MIPDAIESALAEPRRRQAISARDVLASVAHFVGTLPAVCRDGRLTPRGWFSGGAGMPTLAVTTADGTEAVLNLDEPGPLDVSAEAMVAAEGRGYARVLAWDPSRGALLIERLGETCGPQPHP